MGESAQMKYLIMRSVCI